MAGRHRQHARASALPERWLLCTRITLLTLQCRRSERALSSCSVASRLSRITPALRMTTPSLDYYAIEELLTDDERAARDRARRFVQEEVMPEVVPCHRAGKFPEQIRPRM